MFITCDSQFSMSGAEEGELLKRHRLHVHMTKCLKRFDHINHNGILINLVKSHNLSELALIYQNMLPNPQKRKRRKKERKLKTMSHI